mmetsp:Transcript_13528/g.28802  ORF Transcript_13528/g.28802 Transcript_13528/m.28802 type:complete len:149 (+) Transcript_13528:1433-1879(+)
MLAFPSLLRSSSEGEAKRSVGRPRKREHPDAAGGDSTKPSKSESASKKPRGRPPKHLSSAAGARGSHQSLDKLAAKFGSCPSSPQTAAYESEEAEDGKEMDDEALAMALHREMNCTPARSTRTRSLPQRKGPEDHPVHQNDPGILPSC